MMTFRFRELEKYRVGGSGSKMDLEIPPPRSVSGKVRLRCPSDKCSPGVFLIAQDLPKASSESRSLSPLIRRPPGTAGVTCPYCGHDDEGGAYITEEDKKAAIKQIEAAVMQDVSSSLNDAFRGIGRGSRGLITMNVKTPAISKPHFYREDLLRNLKCDLCASEYGVYAIGLFCPNCGTRNLMVHFRREIELIGKQVKQARDVEGSQGDELSYRLLGNAHEDVVTALETYLKVIYRHVVRSRRPDQYEELASMRQIGNKFQNIPRGRELFSTFQVDPYVVLSSEQASILEKNLQKRHVIGHNLSMADDAYVRHSDEADTGETVTLLGEDILAFAELCGIVIERLEQDLPEFKPEAPT